MRIETAWVCAALLLTGCAHSKTPPSDQKSPPPHTYITPHLAMGGRVEMVNPEGRYVVLSFPQGHVPPPGQHWRINHHGLAVGRVTIAGPQRDMNTVADLVEGEASVGDEAVPE
jgi:hypothetical protein